MLFMTYNALLIISVYKKRDRKGDGRTDTPSYRDARTHLKRSRFYVRVCRTSHESKKLIALTYVMHSAFYICASLTR